jgi:hypothetical protein
MNKIKFGLQVLGAAAWLGTWIGIPMWLLERDHRKCQEESRKRDREWRERRGLPPLLEDEE